MLENPGLTSVILVIGITSWMGTARVVRGEILKEREIEYVEAARALGASPARIIIRHLVPNIIGPVIVISTLQVGRAIILEAALSYLGFGTQPPNHSWGSMLAEARSYLATGPWMAIFPGLLLSVTVLSFNFVGDGLASALNPFERKT
jgi:peptide/nickel transport system permease protein